jgi:hypothetical protein
VQIPPFLEDFAAFFGDSRTQGSLDLLPQVLQTSLQLTSYCCRDIPSHLHNPMRTAPYLRKTDCWFFVFNCSKEVQNWTTFNLPKYSSLVKVTMTRFQSWRMFNSSRVLSTLPFTKRLLFLIVFSCFSSFALFRYTR